MKGERWLGLLISALATPTAYGAGTTVVVELSYCPPTGTIPTLQPTTGPLAPYLFSVDNSPSDSTKYIDEHGYFTSDITKAAQFVITDAGQLMIGFRYVSIDQSGAFQILPASANSVSIAPYFTFVGGLLGLKSAGIDVPTEQYVFCAQTDRILILPLSTIDTGCTLVSIVPQLIPNFFGQIPATTGLSQGTYRSTWSATTTISSMLQTTRTSTGGGNGQYATTSFSKTSTLTPTSASSSLTNTTPTSSPTLTTGVTDVAISFVTTSGTSSEIAPSSNSLTEVKTSSTSDLATSTTTLSSDVPTSGIEIGSPLESPTTTSDATTESSATSTTSETSNPSPIGTTTLDVPASSSTQATTTTTTITTTTTVPASTNACRSLSVAAQLCPQYSGTSIKIGSDFNTCYDILCSTTLTGTVLTANSTTANSLRACAGACSNYNIALPYGCLGVKYLGANAESDQDNCLLYGQVNGQVSGTDGVDSVRLIYAGYPAVARRALIGEMTFGNEMN